MNCSTRNPKAKKVLTSVLSFHLEKIYLDFSCHTHTRTPSSRMIVPHDFLVSQNLKTDLIIRDKSFMTLTEKGLDHLPFVRFNGTVI